MTTNECLAQSDRLDQEAKRKRAAGLRLFTAARRLERFADLLRDAALRIEASADEIEGKGA